MAFNIMMMRIHPPTVDMQGEYKVIPSVMIVTCHHGQSLALITTILEIMARIQSLIKLLVPQDEEYLSQSVISC
jgi:hypothetical protein